MNGETTVTAAKPAEKEHARDAAIVTARHLREMDELALDRAKLLLSATRRSVQVLCLRGLKMLIEHILLWQVLSQDNKKIS